MCPYLAAEIRAWFGYNTSSIFHCFYKVTCATYIVNVVVASYFFPCDLHLYLFQSYKWYIITQ